MRTYQKIATLSKKLPLDQQKQILAIVEEMVNLMEASQGEDMTTGKAPKTANPHCPYCQDAHVQKSGKKDWRQRYRCLECKRFFTETTHTVMENSHASRDAWKTVIEDTLEGYSIDYTAKALSMHHETVFHMRHKVLLGMIKFLETDPVVLKEVAELDETYVLESRKGAKFPDDAPRKPRLHGERAEKRGLSDEQICICAGVQRNQGTAYASTVNRASPTGIEIQQVFQGHIEKGSVIFTDGAKGYAVLENGIECAVEGVSVEEQKQRKVANLNNVNSFHSFIKERYGKYRGVATKYLNRYNALFSAGFRNRKEMIERLCESLLYPGPIDYSVTCDDVESFELLDI